LRRIHNIFDRASLEVLSELLDFSYELVCACLYR
jgi:hypothetical protein